ncbi:MAG: methyltransferase domain-containing protein [Desulfobacteraceae bacterium]|nr:MAG: methyltransferase domain-containing protein [Desulfobacteraceae bacterium]
MDLLIKADETIDSFLNGKLQIIQSRQGYRFSVDALLLAEFVSVKREDVVVDLGAGCGIISLFLAVKSEVGFIVGIELQAELASQAKRNIVFNKLEKKIAIIQGDLRHLPIGPGFAHIVVCNPPYRRQKSGRINPDFSKAIARHELSAKLDDILAAGKALLKPGGRLALIYPANRLTEIFAKMRIQEVEPKRLQIVFPNSYSHAKLAMIEGRLQGKSGLKILPPIFGQGRFSIM